MKVFQEISKTVRRWRMTERDFQREADTYRMHLLLSFRSESIKMKGSALIQTVDHDVKVDADSILERTNSLSADIMAKEIQTMLEDQIKQYFRALQVLCYGHAAGTTCH
jgi:hypothetical protein